MLGLINLNTIGAYIVTMLFLALLIQGPRFQDVAKGISELNLISHFLIFLFLCNLSIQTLKLFYFGFLAHVPFLLIDGMNFWIHEAGHIYFRILGETLAVMGGTLMQILTPAFFFYRSYKNNYIPLRYIMLFWIGQNLPHVGGYIADARAQKLELAGPGTHDWKYLLGKFGLMESDIIIGRIVTWLGILIMMAGLIQYILFIFKMQKEKSLK